MGQARIWDLDGWESPVTVANLTPERDRGYFALCLGVNFKAVVYDAAGQLYIKANLPLRPDKGLTHESWLCTAEYAPGGGIALRIPRPAYEAVSLEKGNLAGYLAVSEVF